MGLAAAKATTSPVSRTASHRNHPIMSDGEFENTGSGASLTIPCQASGIKKNGYMIIKGRPCKVVDTSTSKTGKHGSAKVHFTAIDIFNGKKYEDLAFDPHPPGAHHQPSGVHPRRCRPGWLRLPHVR